MKSGIPERAERLSAAETKEFARTNKVWNDGHFNAISRVGMVFDVIKRANREYLTSSDYATCSPVMPPFYWEDYYFSQEKSEQEIMLLAEEFKEACGNAGIKISSRIALCFTLYRIIDQTYDGLVNEMMALLMLQSEHPDMEFSVSGDRIDRKYGVDFIGRQRGRIVKAFQQKPEKFFTSVERYCEQGSPDWVKASANAHYRANMAFEREHEVPVEYIALRKQDGAVELVYRGPFITTMAKRGRKGLKAAGL